MAKLDLGKLADIAKTVASASKSSSSKSTSSSSTKTVKKQVLHLAVDWI